MTVFFGIAAVLFALNVVTHRPSDPRRLDAVHGIANVSPIKVDEQAIRDLVSKQAPHVGPAALGGALTLSGGPGLAASLQVTRENDGGVAWYRVRIQNIGTMPFDVSFSTGDAYVDTAEGSTYCRPVVRSLTGGSGSSPTIDPATQADLALNFEVPAQLKPTELRLSLRLGQFYPTAIWTLTP